MSANDLPSRDRLNASPERRGQALVEFAIISFVLSAMLAGLLGIMVLALGSFQNNIATENAGRLLDRHVDLNAMDLSDPEEIYNKMLEVGIYDESQLVMKADDYYDPKFKMDLPEINQSLLGSYIFDPDLKFEDEDKLGGFRYPGALVTNEDGQRTILIPLFPDPTDLNARGIDRSDNLNGDGYPISDDWVAPVCVAATDDPNQYKVVIFYPSQPASMIQLTIERDADGRIVSQTPVIATDDAIMLSDLPVGYQYATPTTLNPQFEATPSRGQYGLGTSFAFTTTVRPYRQIFESSSVFRLYAPHVVRYAIDPNTQVNIQAVTTNVTEMPIEPFVAYQSNKDQFLDFNVRDIDSENEDDRMYLAKDPKDTNDFKDRVLFVPEGGAGIWQVDVSAVAQPIGSNKPNDKFALRLYHNGEFKQTISQRNGDDMTSNNEIRMDGRGMVVAEEGDALQVRMFTDSTNGARLTSKPEDNWVMFQRLSGLPAAESSL